MTGSRGGWRIGLRLRLWLGALALTLLALIAAGLAAYGLTRMQAAAAEAIAAQRRIEAYGIVSARMGEWLIEWLAAPQGADAAPDPQSVLAALDRLDGLVARDVAEARSDAEATARTRTGAVPARLRAMILRLDQDFRTTAPATPAGRAALTLHNTQSAPAIAQQIEADSQRRDAALREMEGLRLPLLAAAVAVALAAAVGLAAFWLAVLRPLFTRLTLATRDAPALAMGLGPPGPQGHDELGLMFARLRQMAGRIARRRARLEETVAARTADLRAANDRLARIDHNRRRFFADVGHELRTPLTVIMGEAELGAAHPDPETRASFQTIGARSARLFRRIEDMLRIARSESGRLELAEQPVDLRAVVATAQADLAPVLRRAGVLADVDLPPLTLRGDADWLRQVFAGFFENAAKYAGRGATIRIRALADGTQARIRISDTGPGLPPGAEATIFDRFTRAQDPARAQVPGGGFGVGLALAQWVVEASDGRLDLVSDREEAGLTLDLTLPLWREG